MNLNNKGFTLVEVLAVIVIIGVLTGIAIPSVMSSINASKKSSEKLLIHNINIAAQALYEEVEFLGTSSNLKNKGGQTIRINDGMIEVSLQDLVDNGFLKVSDDNNSDDSTFDLINPSNNEKIGDCVIEIKKIVENYDVRYEITNISSDDKCFSNYDYE